VLGYLEDVEIEQTAAYIRRGRSFAQLTDDELREAWVETVQTYARDPISPGARMVETATRTELTLRGPAALGYRARHALEGNKRKREISAKASKLFESLDRGKLMEIEEQLVTDLSAYLHSRDCPQN
jgi:hypothetical protein